MKVLIIASVNLKNEEISTLSTITAGLKLCAKVDVLIAGHNILNCVKSFAKIDGVQNIIYANSKVYKNAQIEQMLKIANSLAKKYTHIFSPADSFGKILIPTMSALNNMQAISEIIEVINPKTFKRPIYAGSAILTVKSNDAKIFATVRSSAFTIAKAGLKTAKTKQITAPQAKMLCKYLELKLENSRRPDLSTAKIVLTSGGGMYVAKKNDKSGKSIAKNFQIMEEIADILGAAIGATRLVVDRGGAESWQQIGQTGITIAPDLYIGAGVSGAPQHIAGIGDSKIIVAINNDIDARILKVADYYLLADLTQTLIELKRELLINATTKT